MSKNHSILHFQSKKKPENPNEVIDQFLNSLDSNANTPKKAKNDKENLVFNTNSQNSQVHKADTESLNVIEAILMKDNKPKTEQKEIMKTEPVSNFDNNLDVFSYLEDDNDKRSKTHDDILSLFEENNNNEEEKPSIKTKEIEKMLIEEKQNGKSQMSKKHVSSGDLVKLKYQQAVSQKSHKNDINGSKSEKVKSNSDLTLSNEIKCPQKIQPFTVTKIIRNNQILTEKQNNTVSKPSDDFFDELFGPSDVKSETKSSKSEQIGKKTKKPIQEVEEEIKRCETLSTDKQVLTNKKS